ncbi:glycosyltransferase [Zobellia laminariae]|uniref:glycosyltransferase n=1 Tax=Zobellia laminariae TaxID=248906 RepID=UPI0012D89BFA|nr:glycosyltransferase [Zobellia laminariae]
MKTICFFNSVENWGGGEKWHFDTSLYMHKKGHQVLVIAHEKSELLNRLKDTGVPTIGLKVGNLSFLNQAKIDKIKNILIEHQVGCIIINLSRDLKLAGLAAKKAGTEKIIYRRGSAIPIKDSVLNRYYFKNVVTHILANSEATKKTVLQNNSSLFPKEKIKIIHNGIDVKKFISNKATPLYTKTSEDEIVITSLGRLEYEKNHQFLILLSKELKNRNLKHTILIGGDGSLKNSLINKAIENGIKDNIKFLGFIKNPKDLLESGDIFILPSMWEGFGYVLVEASLCKKPIIAFNTTSIPEIIQNNKSGFIVEPNNVITTADKVEVLKKNKNLRNSMGEAGYEYASKNFDNIIIFNKIEDYLISKVINNKITALLITYNEIEHIDAVLENIDFADEIIVVDSFSTDGTVERIKAHSGVKFIQREFKNYTDQKAYAMEQASNDWILFLDADERLTPELRKEVIETVNTNDEEISAYYFYRTFMFKKEELRYSGWQSDKNYRLFKKSKVNFTKDRIVHETLVVKGKSDVLKHRLIHYSYKNYEDYKSKMVKYGQMKAIEELPKNYSPNAYHFIVRPSYKFINHYILRLGILDGKKGLIICYLNALGVYSRYKELKRLKSIDKK